jgi:nucleotide-binding universal stress UspA family protein
MATIFRRILCPVDFSQNSTAILDQAAHLARRDDAVVYLTHVVFVPMNDPAELDRYDVTVSTQPAMLRLQQLARKHLAKVRHEFIVQVGWPAEVIERIARELEVDLIVMATHGRTGMAHLFLGSIAEHVVRTSQRSVLTFAPGASLGTLKEILCPVAFDANSISALNFGWRLAQKYAAAISLLHVVPVPFEPSEVPLQPLTPEWEQDARARLAKLAAENLGAKANYSLIVRRGDPALGILEVEKERRPHLIVMATHGRTGLSHMVLGSVAERTVRESTVPVLTVR